MTDVLRFLDDHVDGPAIVFGSLPPEGRDVDLLVRPPERRRLETALAEAGFERAGMRWVLFQGCSTFPIDVVPASDWALPPAEIDALFADALVLAGSRHLRRPAPHHALLILARRIQEDGAFDDKRRQRLDRAFQEDPAVADKAASHASAWRVESALARLSVADPPRIGRSHGPLRRALSVAAGRSRRGAVVSLSGLDGSGKSYQAQALKSTLQRLGYDVTVEWTRLQYSPALEAIAKPVKAVLRLRGVSDASAEPDPGAALRRRDPRVSAMWALIVALTNGLAHLRRTLPVRAGTVVICDRYTLDSAVHLRFLYGGGRELRLHSAIVSALSPRPMSSFFIDVPPEVAIARKAEQYGLEELSTQAKIYRSLYRRFGAVALDGRLDAGEICEEIARTVWRALSSAEKVHQSSRRRTSGFTNS